MGKLKREFKNPENDTFNWDLYSDGYNGRNLARNTSVQTPKGTIVYCHEPYAKELFAMYTHNAPVQEVSAKDLIPGATMQVKDVRPVDSNDKRATKTEIIIDTVGGGSCRIDLNKEREFVNMYSNATPETLAAAFGDAEFKDEFLKKTPVIKVVDKTHVSLWGGHIAQLEAEFARQRYHQTIAYNATVLSTNAGGYIVDVDGLKCFMPGSMAAAGIITDFAALVGKTIPVMVVNYIPDKGFVVSYKKYLSAIMPAKVREELSIDMRVNARVTGLSKNGVFVQFDDKNGEPTFSGLIYRDEMTPHMEDLFNEGNIIAGDSIYSYIHSIDIDGEKVRIVLGDTPTTDPVFMAKKYSKKS